MNSLDAVSMKIEQMTNIKQRKQRKHKQRIGRHPLNPTKSAKTEDFA